MARTTRKLLCHRKLGALTAEAVAPEARPSRKCSCCLDVLPGAEFDGENIVCRGCDDDLMVEHEFWMERETCWRQPGEDRP